MEYYHIAVEKLKPETLKLPNFILCLNLVCESNISRSSLVLHPNLSFRIVAVENSFSQTVVVDGHLVYRTAKFVCIANSLLKSKNSFLFWRHKSYFVNFNSNAKEVSFILTFTSLRKVNASKKTKELYYSKVTINLT